MELFEEFTNLWSQDQDTRIAALQEANAGMHDVVNTEREMREASERQLRPFKEYVEASRAMAAKAAPTPQPTGTPCRPKSRSQRAN